jgi:hypothetical protein
MEECKNSVAMDCQAVDTPHQEAGIKRPPPSKPLMKPLLNGMSALSSNPYSADESSRAHDPSSAFRQHGDCPWCVLVSDNQRRMDHRPPSSVEDCPREECPHDHPGNPSANHLCSSSSSSHCGLSACAATSLPPCSGPGEPCPSTPLCAPLPASSHSGILTRGQPTLEAIGLAGQDLFGEGSDRGSHRSTHHRCQYPLPHAVRDLPSGGPTGRHGDNPPSGRRPPRDASSFSSERYQASCCNLQSIPCVQQRSRAFPRHYNTNSCSRPYSHSLEYP